jgi:hypothetical protein
MPVIATWMSLSTLFTIVFAGVAAVVYRRWYAGRYWVREVFAAMALVSAIASSIWFAAVGFGLPASHALADSGSTVAVTGVGIVAGFVFGVVVTAPMFALAGIAVAWFVGLFLGPPRDPEESP